MSELVGSLGSLGSLRDPNDPIDPASLFWEKHFFNNIVHLHRIIPTLMFTVVKDREDIEYSELKKCHSTCCVCAVNIMDETVALGIRCLITKIDTLYMSSFVSCCFCSGCALERKIFCIMDSDQDTINVVLDTFEDQAKDLNMILENRVDIHVEHFFECLVNRIKVVHQDMMKRIAKITSNCDFCKKKVAIGACNSCHFYKYCSEKCSKRDWKSHKKECFWLKTISIFMKYKYHVMIR